MTIRTLPGHRTWEGERDEDGYKTFDVLHLVECEKEDGPDLVMDAPGLPAPGSTWQFGNDNQVKATCTRYRKVAIHEEKEGEAGRFWTALSRFTTKPKKKCEDENPDNDPLQEKEKVSGSFTKYQREMLRNRFGRLMTSSSHELLRGSSVEFDDNYPTIKIEKNVETLELGLCSSLMNCVNDAPLWGLPKRCVKLSGLSWEKKYQGGGCEPYYTRSFDFEINFNTFDRFVPDEGTKVLLGHWKHPKKNDPSLAGIGTTPGGNNNNGIDDAVEQSLWVLNKVNGKMPDYRNPCHFQRFKDRNGENTKTLLNGYGLPVQVPILLPGPEVTGTGSDIGSAVGTGSQSIIWNEDAAMIKLEYYPEANLLLLGIPTEF